LIIVLFSIIVIILGKTFITSTNKSPKELNTTIIAQRQQIIKDQKYISYLTSKISDLNDSLLFNDMACNDRAIQMERSYSQKLIEQQQYVTQTIDEIKKLMGNKFQYTQIKMSTDSILISKPRNNETKIIEKLDNIKNKVKN